MKQSLTIITSWIRFIFPLKKFCRVLGWAGCEGKLEITPLDLNIFQSVDIKAFSQYIGKLKTSEFASDCEVIL